MKRVLILIIALFCLAYSQIEAQNEGNKKVAILETVDKEGRVSYGVKLMVRSKLSTFITATPGYEGYDRVDVGAILGEHEFQRTGLVSDSQIKRLGEMTGADYILVAEVAYLNDSYIFLSAKILNVETARVEQTADLQTQATVEALDQNCKILAGKLLNVNTETGAVKGELIINGNRYIGEHKNGKPHGKGVKLYDDTNLKSYEGDWYYGKRQGKGTLIWQDGSRYVGDWKNDFRDGYGVQYDSDGEIYEGNWLNGKKHGKGKLTFASDDSLDRKYYDGDWVNGVRQGTGTMVWNDGDKYVGSWKDGKLYGKGVFYYNDGDKFNGDWVNGKKHGKGTYYWTDGSYEVANYVHGVINGFATYYYGDGSSYSKGNYENGKKEGKWEVYLFGKHTWTYTYKNGIKKHEKYYKNY